MAHKGHYFILVLIVFLSLSNAEEMFSPRNYTFHRGKKYTKYIEKENGLKNVCLLVPKRVP